MFDVQKPDVIANFDSLRFIQAHVKRPTVEAKKWIAHLKSKWGSDWREHRTEIRGLNGLVAKEMSLIDLELPIVAEKRGDLYLIKNGTHTCYAFWESRYDGMPLRLDNLSLTPNCRTYSLKELKVEEN